MAIGGLNMATELVRAAQHALDVLVALPLFVVFVFLSPLLKPRGDVVYPRYRYVNGIWCKTFLADDMVDRPPDPINQPQPSPADPAVQRQAKVPTWRQ
jgi:hypothetical protein